MQDYSNLEQNDSMQQDMQMMLWGKSVEIKIARCDSMSHQNSPKCFEIKFD